MKYKENLAICFVVFVLSVGNFASAADSISSQKDANSNTDESVSKSNDQYPNYILLKYGNFSDLNIGGINDNFFWKKNIGDMREVEFNYGNKEAARILGGVRVDANNNVTNYLLGYIFADDSQFKIRTFSVDDDMYFSKDTYHYGIYPTYYLGHITATTNEISYLKKNYYFTYGHSNIPVKMSVDTHGFFPDNRGTVIDLAPNINYLDAGMFHNGLKPLFTSSSNNWNWYFNGSVALRLISITTSDNVVDQSDGPTPAGKSTVKNLGIANVSGYDTQFDLRAEIGEAYSLKVAGVKGIIGAGAFVNLAGPFLLNNFYQFNTTSTGYSFKVPNFFNYGLNVTAGLSF